MDLKFPKDKIMQSLYEQVIAIKPIDSIIPIPEERYFSDLCESIIGQQLSNKVADVIISRAKVLCEGNFDPVIITKISVEEFRSVGLSNAKANYIKNLSNHWQNGDIKYSQFKDLSDEEIITELIQVKGIGRWTAEMFLIFSLGRMDVYSYGDLILRTGVIKYYKIRKVSQKRIEQIAQKWSPNRTLASRVLWRAKDLNI
jgi:DNA-3-methyladenine glycosylase II